MRNTQEKFARADLAGVTGPSMPVVVELIRHANSTWAFRFRVKGEATLPDGRVVTIDRHIAVRANEQIGRKPRIAVA